MEKYCIWGATVVYQIDNNDSSHGVFEIEKLIIFTISFYKSIYQKESH